MRNMQDMLVKENCPDCGVVPGERHHVNCDVARCVVCGAQSFGCAYAVDEDDADSEFRCSNTEEVIPDETQIWTGLWPGVEECEEFGWFSRWTQYSQYADDIPDGGPSVQCERDHPHAHHDLNRLISEGMSGRLRWDRERTRWFFFD